MAESDTSRVVFVLVNGEGSLEPPLCRAFASGECDSFFIDAFWNI